MDNLKNVDLTISLKEDKNLLKMEWFGKCNAKDTTEILMTYFEGLLNELKENNEIEIDFSQLSFINSSSIILVLDLISKLENKSIKSRIIYDNQSKWQRLSFKAFGAIVETMKYVEVNDNNKK